MKNTTEMMMAKKHSEPKTKKPEMQLRNFSPLLRQKMPLRDMRKMIKKRGVTHLHSMRLLNLTLIQKIGWHKPAKKV